MAVEVTESSTLYRPWLYRRSPPGVNGLPFKFIGPFQRGNECCYCVPARQLAPQNLQAATHLETIGSDDNNMAGIRLFVFVYDFNHRIGWRIFNEPGKREQRCCSEHGRVCQISCHSPVQDLTTHTSTCSSACCAMLSRKLAASAPDDSVAVA
ncbi:unnamed protein product [Ascophyllum nodosum]